MLCLSRKTVVTVFLIQCWARWNHRNSAKNSGFQGSRSVFHELPSTLISRPVHSLCQWVCNVDIQVRNIRVKRCSIRTRYPWSVNTVQSLESVWNEGCRIANCAYSNSVKQTSKLLAIDNRPEPWHRTFWNRALPIQCWFVSPVLPRNYKNSEFVCAKTATNYYTVYCILWFETKTTTTDLWTNYYQITGIP